MAEEKLMTLAGDQVVSAQVVLRSATGKALAGSPAITAETIKDYVPSPEAAARTAGAFQREGFQVGSMVGNSFSITAPAATFERVFRTKLQQNAKGGVQPASAPASDPYVLSAAAAPADVAGFIAAVTFTPPPDFGPTSFGR